MKKVLWILLIALMIFQACDNGTKVQIEDLQSQICSLQKVNDSLSNEIKRIQVELDNYRMAPEKLCANIDELFKNEDLSSLKKIQTSLKQYHPESAQCRMVSEYVSKIENKIQKRNEEERIKQEKAAKEAEAVRLQAVNKLKKSHDDVSGTTWYKNPYFTHYTNSNKTSVYMGIKEGSKPWLRLKMSYEGDNWIFFEKAYLSYDGNTKEIIFDKYKDKESDNSGGKVWEWIDVAVDDFLLVFLREMVNGKDVKMRFTGKYSNTRTLSKNEIKGIEDVLLGYDVLRAD